MTKTATNPSDNGQNNFISEKRTALRLRSICLAGAMILGAPALAHADVASTSKETLMQALFQEAFTLYQYSAPVSPDLLNYDFSVNTTSGSFSYSTLPGQIYNGQTFSVTGTGSYDPSTTSYAWTASGLLGASTWMEAGYAQWTGDPTAVTGTVTDLNGKVLGTINGTVQLSQGAGGGSGDASTGTVTFTAKGAAPGTGGVFDITDKIPGGGGAWTITWDGHSVRMFVNADFEPRTDLSGLISGNCRVAVAAPELSTWALMLLGFAGLGLLRRRRAMRRTPV